MPSLRLIIGAVGRAFLFAVACWVLCLTVVEVGFGHNLYFKEGTFATVTVPAMLGGLMHFAFTARRWFRRPLTPGRGT